MNATAPQLIPAEGLSWKKITVHDNVTAGSRQEINPIISMLNSNENRGFVSLAVSRSQTEQSAILIAYSDQSRTYNRLLPAGAEQLFRVNLRKDNIDGQAALRFFFLLDKPVTEELTIFLDSFLLNLSRTALDSGLALEANYITPGAAERKTQTFTACNQLDFPARNQALKIQRIAGSLKSAS